MTVDEMKAAYRRMIDEAAHGGRLDTIDELYAEDCVWHGPAGVRLVGRNALKENIGIYRTGFPGFRITVHHQFGQGDHLATRWSVVGKHDGPLGDLPATGEGIDIPAMTISRFEGDLIAEEWELFDEMLMMRQLGVVDD
jgi:steroid delta-isomerase-like uncharacterized protein